MKKTLLIFALSVFTLSHALPEEPTVPQIGVKAPSFTAQSTNGKVHVRFINPNEVNYFNKYGNKLRTLSRFGPVAYFSTLGISFAVSWS